MQTGVLLCHDQNLPPMEPSACLPSLLSTRDFRKGFKLEPSAGGKSNLGRRRVKVTVVQCRHQSRGAELASVLHEVLKNELEGEKSDFVVFPEDWMHCGGSVSLEKNKALKHLSKAVAQHRVYAILGTMTEMDQMKDGSRGHFKTTVVMGRNGQVIGKYKKRRATRTGAHDEGTEVGVFDTEFGKIAVMICFDIENEDIFKETLEHKPRLLFNPTFIPRPTSIKDTASPLSLSTWTGGLASMSHKFEAICREKDLTIVRCDTAFPNAMGTSQVMTPEQTTYASTLEDTTFSVYVDLDAMCDGKSFQHLVSPAEVPRTRLVDQTGARYSLKYLPRRRGALTEVQLLDPMMKMAAACSDGTVKVYNMNTTLCMATFEHSAAVHSIVASRTHIWSACGDGTIHRWNAVLNKLEERETLCNFGKGNNRSKDDADTVTRLLLAKGNDSSSSLLLYCGCRSGVVSVVGASNFRSGVNSTEKKKQERREAPEEARTFSQFLPPSSPSLPVSAMLIWDLPGAHRGHSGEDSTESGKENVLQGKGQRLRVLVVARGSVVSVYPIGDVYQTPEEGSTPSSGIAHSPTEPSIVLRAASLDGGITGEGPEAASMAGVSSFSVIDKGRCLVACAGSEAFIVDANDITAALQKQRSKVDTRADGSFSCETLECFYSSHIKLDVWANDAVACGSLLFIAGADGSVLLYDTEKGSPVFQFVSGHSACTCVRYNGKDRLFTAGVDGECACWKFTLDRKPLDLSSSPFNRI